MLRSRSPSALYLAWERIVFGPREAGGQLPRGAEREWSELWREHVAGERLSHTPVDEVWLLANLGYSLAMQRGECQEALSRIRRCFDHPDWERCGRVEQDCVSERIACALWYGGDHAEAIDECRRLLQHKAARYGVPRSLVRNLLFRICHDAPPSEVPSIEFGELVRGVVRGFRGCIRLSRRVVPGESTWGEIAAVLDRTYPNPVSASDEGS